ncbi:MAG: ROK family protein [Deltaproteobacteria bacterium]|nr:ROK family protein [Deltaproteobacteria bacterium]
MMTAAIGIDIGGSSLRAAIVEHDGRIVRAKSRRLGERSPEALLNQLEDLLQSLGGAGDAAMAVGLAAVIRLQTGVVTVAPNLGWHQVPFAEMLARRFGRPVRLVNDLDAITVGEAACGAGKGATDVVCVFVGTGVGMGAVVDGRVLEGCGGTATELGHIKVESTIDGRLCGCGERGCLETYASGRHLPELVRAKVERGRQTRLVADVEGHGDWKALTAERIEAAAKDGDEVAREVWRDAAGYLGRAIGNLVTIFNPRVLVLGGGVLEAAPSLRRAVVAGINADAARPQLADVSIRDSELGDQAGLVGAGLLAHQAALARVGDEGRVAPRPPGAGVTGGGVGSAAAAAARESDEDESGPTTPR